MTAIGYVTKNDNGSYKGQLKTVSIRADIDIIPNRDKSAETHPDFRVVTQGVEIGAGWIRRGENSGKDYVSLSLAAPEFGPRKRTTDPFRAAGEDDDSVFAVIWNPADWLSPAPTRSARGPFSRRVLLSALSRRSDGAHATERQSASMRASISILRLSCRLHVVHADSRPALSLIPFLN